MRVLLFVVLLSVARPVFAGEEPYAISRIPKPIMAGANAVIRLDDTEFTIQNAGEAVYKRRFVVTVLNENGNSHAAMSHYYDDREVIRSFEGTLYDAAGKEIRSLKKKDIADESITQGSLIADTRVKHHSFSHRNYPYTVEYEIEVKYNGTLFFPDWHPQSASMLGIEQSSFVVSTPADYTFRYRGYQQAPEPVITEAKSRRIYTWKLSGLRAIAREAYAPSLRMLTPLVLLGPTDFEIHGFKGNMSDWKSFGKFNWELSKGRDVLPDDVKQEVHRVADGISSAPEKVKRLYKYMQENTRYISIQLGIGGWQPLEAKFVSSKKYGDCKALSNYMYAILKEAGIKSYYALIRAGRGQDIRADFPAQQFNHAILCVPVASDTIWLECTDQFATPGYMGSFTGDRHALLIDENGGQLVRTPSYSPDQSLLVRNSVATVDEAGNISLKLNSLHTGIQQDELQNFLTRSDKRKIQERLQEQFDLATYHVNNFQYREIKEAIPALEEQLDMNIANYATVTGKRLFIQPNLVSRYGSKMSADSSRKFPIVMGNGWKDVDTVSFILPGTYTKEAMPADTKFQSKFGEYSSSIVFDGSKITYYRSLLMRGGNYQPADYNELVDFYEKIFKADRSRVVLVKKE